MPSSSLTRLKQLAREAEGYLELNLPEHALAVLDRVGDPGSFRSTFAYLRGEALRELRRWNEALVPLREAAEMAPSDIRIWLALGWCYKRIGRLDLAIEALEEALEARPDEALIHYNLACYWCLAENKERTLHYLARSFDLDSQYRDLVAAESDFNALRADPDFQAIVSINV